VIADQDEGGGACPGGAALLPEGGRPRLASLLESAALGQAALAANGERSEASTSTGASVHGTEVGYSTTRHCEATL